MSDDLVVGLEELADLVGVTGETMRGHLKAVEGNPDWLIERGDRGRAYKIAARGGIAWWAAKREADDAAAEDRKAKLAQMRFDLVGDGAETGDKLTLSGRQRKEEYEAAFKGLEYRRRMGELVLKADLDHVLTGAAVDLRRRLMLVPGELAIVTGLPIDQLKPALDRLLSRAIESYLTAIAPISDETSAA